MKFGNKILGVAGIIGAPFLAIGIINVPPGKTGMETMTGWIAVAELVYMLGWMCSIYALQRAGAAGQQRWTNNVFKTQLVLLAIANVYNIWSIPAVGLDMLMYKILDLSWPLSNIFMLVTTIAVFKANVLQGWKKYTVLAAALWLPLTVITGVTGIDKWNLSLWYSGLAWAAMGLAAFGTRKQSIVYNQFGYPKLTVTN